MNKHKRFALFLVLVLMAGILFPGCAPEPTEPSTPTTQPTQPSTPTLTVDWEMQAYMCHPTGTTTDFFTIQVDGNILEEADDTYLQLNIDLPETFRFQPTTPSDAKGDLRIGGGPGQYIAKSVYQNQETGAPAECIWAIDTDKEYFIAYWGDEFGQFLVATADLKSDYNDVLRHFRDFIYTHCYTGTAPTVWDFDWQMYGMWIGEDGQVEENIEFILTGMAAHHPELPNHSLTDIEIRWPEGYRFYSPGTRLGARVLTQYPEGLYIDGGIDADDRQGKEIVLGYFGLAPEQGFFWLYWEKSMTHERLPGYLIASTDPNTSREDIEAFFAEMMADEGFQ